MKTKYVLFAALGAFALTAVSCINEEWGGKVDDSADIPIEQEPVVVPSNDLLDFTPNEVVKLDKEGNLSVYVESEGKASVTAALTPGKDTEIPGELAMTANEDLPDFCSSESGAVLSNASVILELSNPSPTLVSFGGEIFAENKSAKFPKLMVPAQSNNYKIALALNPAALSDVADVNEVIKVDDNVADVINHISKDKGITIKNLTVTPAETRAIAPAAEDKYEFSVGAIYYSPLWFPAGTELKFDIDFTGELIDVSEYNVTVNDYQLEADVTNTIPFSIDGTGTSTNGVTATLNTPIKAGDTNQPVTTKVLIHIKSTADVMNLEGAVLHLILKTDKDVKVNKNQKLDIDMKSIKFSQKK